VAGAKKGDGKTSTIPQISGRARAAIQSIGVHIGATFQALKAPVAGLQQALLSGGCLARSGRFSGGSKASNFGNRKGIGAFSLRPVRGDDVEACRP
jgi:hypothetical protein